MPRTWIKKTATALALVPSLLLVSCGDEAPAPGTRTGVKAELGVTAAPCPDGHPERGCIYLGAIVDQSGPFANAGKVFLDAIRAFWSEVNAGDGIGGRYDVAMPYHLVKDNQYNPAIHTALYTQIADQVLAIAASMGTPPTMDVLPRLIEDQTLTVPISYWSGWTFPAIDGGVVIEYLPSYCFEGMNAMDWMVESAAAEKRRLSSVGVAFFPSDFGRDYLAGVRAAAAAHGVEVRWEQPVIPIAAGGDPAQVEAVNRVMQEPPDVVFLVLAPGELAAIVGGAVQRGFTGLFLTGNPGWDAGLLETAAAPAFTSGRVFGSGPFRPWATEAPGQARAREVMTAAGIAPHDYAINGWLSQYRLLAILEAAVDAGDLTREGLLRVSDGLAAVNHDGMRPTADWRNPTTAPRDALIARFDSASPTGLSVVRDYFVGPTAESYPFDRPCTEPLAAER